MIIELNNGTQIDIPVLSYSVPREYKWQYAENSSNAHFMIFGSYCDALDSLNNPWSNPNDVYTICNDLRYPHESSYYETGSGKTNIDTILAKSIWVLGDINNGGILMTKVSSYYGFISFSGIYTSMTSSDMVYYGFQSPIFSLSGEWFGCMTKSELNNGTLYNDAERDNNSLWFYYQPDGYQFIKYEGNVEIRERKDIIAAMDSSEWGYAPSVQPPFIENMPRYSWIIDQHLNNNYYEIGEDTIVREGFQHTAGSIYDDSEIDPTKNPYARAGTSTTGGGGGKWDSNTDSVPIPTDSQFTTDAINSGFLTLYNPTKAEIQSFNDYLFSGITEDMATVLKRLISDPLDYVIFIAMCHFTPTYTSTEYIKFCGLNSGVSAKKIDKQMFYIDCGTVKLDETSETASFLSYSPYYKVSIFLPYIGIISLNPDDVMGSDIHVGYWIDLVTGSCTAYIECYRAKRGCVSDVPILSSVLGTYTGNCYLQLPLTSTDWRGLFSSVVQFAGGLVSTIGGNAAGGMGAMAAATISEKVSVSRSGQLGTNYGYMGRQKPYLILERPNINMPDRFGEWEGYTTNILKNIGELSGYTEIDANTLWTNDFDGILQEEVEMLKAITSSGFYVN